MQSIQKLNRFYPLFLYYSEKKYRKIKKQKDKSIQPLNRLHVSALIDRWKNKDREKWGFDRSGIEIRNKSTVLT